MFTLTTRHQTTQSNNEQCFHKQYTPQYVVEQSVTTQTLK